MHYQKRIPVRTKSIFESLNISIEIFFSIIIDWSTRLQKFSTVERSEIFEKVYKKVII